MHAFLLENPQVIFDSRTLKHKKILTRTLSPIPRERRQTLEAICASSGYVDQDEIRLNHDTPDLTHKLATLFEEHKHEDEEVFFITEGAGIFDVRDEYDRFIRIILSPGDLIIIPEQCFHRFTLDTTRCVVATRMFRNKKDWNAIARDQPSPL